MKKIFLSLLALVSIVALANTEMMKIHYKDGTTALIDVATIDSISFEQAITPATINVTGITLTSAQVEITPTAGVGKYNMGIVKKSEFDASGSDQAFCQKQLEEFKKGAAEWGMNLSEYLDFSLYDESEGPQKVTNSDLEPGTEYYAYAYGMSTADGATTTPIEKFAFSTKGLLNINFNLSTSQNSSKSGIISANPDQDIYYYLGFTSEDAFLNAFGGDDATLRDNALAQIINNMTMGGEFEQLARKGAANLAMQGLVPNTTYYAIAFGVEKKGTTSAFATTNLTTVKFVTPAFSITDDCTFSIANIDASSMLIDFTVTPSKADTRYYATIKSDKETAGKTPAQVADEQIVFEDGFNIDWANSKQVFAGTRTLNSRTDLGVTTIVPETDYTIYVFGVDTKGNRTTEVATAKARTTTAEPSKLTIAFEGVIAGSEPDSQDFFKTNYFVNYTPNPSVENEYYYVGIASKEDYEWATVFGSDEDFIKEVITAAGDNIMLNCFIGKPAQPLKAQVDYKGAALKPGTDYYLIAFGYMGAATTPLFKQAVRTTGEPETGGWGK